MAGSGYGSSKIIINLLKLGSEFNNIKATYTLASILYEGLGEVKRDKEGAKIIMKQLSDERVPLAMVKYGVWLVQENNREGLKYLNEAAEAKIDLAYNQLGHLYRKGRLVPKDENKAKEYYQLAALQGSPESEFYLGIIKSRETTPNHKEVISHFEKAAMSGMGEAQYNLGLKYMLGEGIDKNFNLCKEYWQMAANQKFPLAMLNLAKLYLQGIDGKIEREKARNLLIEMNELFKNTKYAMDSNTLLSTIDNPDPNLLKINTDNSNNNKDKGGCSIM
ncbi:HCP-like protein [Neoconidiobolus thromboides FSU 785]|nr:HCP-like protein [Neoconidiobolus thromboides FSU 785]